MTESQENVTHSSKLFSITNGKLVFLVSVVLAGFVTYQYGVPEGRRHDGRRSSSRVFVLNTSSGIPETFEPSSLGPHGKFRGSGRIKVASKSLGINLQKNNTDHLRINPLSSASPAEVNVQLPTYMVKLQERYSFRLVESFSGYTLAYALGSRGIEMDISRRFSEQSDDGIKRYIRTKEERWVLDPDDKEPDSGESREPFAFLAKKALFLSTDPIPGKYGLTNVLMVLASFFAYASMDNRVVVFPEASSLPLPINELLDIEATQSMLSPLNVVFLDPKNESLGRIGVSGPFLARSMGFRFPPPTGIHPTQLKASFRAFKSLGNTMFHNKQHRYFVQRDFFLHFPFGVYAPFDMCFFIKRMVFHQSIRRSAMNLLRALKNGVDFAPEMIQKKGVSDSASGDASPDAPSRAGALRELKSVVAKKEPVKTEVKRLMSVHLRLEFDAGLIDKNVNSLRPEELTRFFVEDLIPVARKAECDAIYICSGKLSDEVLAALSIASNASGNFPLFLKQMIPADVSFDTKGFTKTTSHRAAATDALIMAHSAIAVVFYHSTFALSVAAQRCPSPGMGENTTLARWRYGGRHSDDLVRWTTPDEEFVHFDQKPPFNGPKPDLKRIEDELGNSLEPGFFTYTFKRDKVFGKPIDGNDGGEARGGGPAFSRLHWVDCRDSGWCRASTMRLDKKGDATMGEHDVDLGI